MVEVRAALRKVFSRVGRARARLLRDAIVGEGAWGAGIRLYDRMSLMWAVRVARSRIPRLGLRRTVPIESLLVGWEAGVPPTVAARAGGGLLRGSVPVADGPHAALLASVEALGDAALDPDALWGSPWGRNARHTIALTGSYCRATDAVALAAVARAVVGAASGEPWGSRKGGSPPGVPIRVRPIRGANAFQVVDGHHRAAAAGRTDPSGVVEVRVERPAVRTPLQRHLLAMSWLTGRPELCQPVDRPDVRGWPLVRVCSDRMSMMDAFLAREGIDPATSSYLDVAACYGWFVAQMRDRGFDAVGLELDPLAPALATALYGLDAGALHTSEAVAYLREREAQPATVVSCFSLLQHFVLGRAEHPPEVLLRCLDQATERVLFFDMGQATERWFRRSMPTWTPDHIESWLRSHSTFAVVERLGVDTDDRPPFEGNYGRTLFALRRG